MKKYISALAFFVIFTPLMTYPMVLHLADAVPGPPWDNFVWLYDLWWFRHSIFDLGISPWFNPQMFHPFGYNVGLSETILASKALGLPVLLLGGDTLAFNILVLASFVLSGFTMYLLVLRLTLNPWAALLSGTTYAFAPYRIHALAAGWIPLLPTQWLPLTLLYLDKALDERRSRPAVMAGFFAALSALSSWYYAYMLVIILPIYVLVRARPWRFTLTDRRLWKAAAAFVTVVATLTVPVAIPAAGLGSSSLSWSLGYADRWSASLDDFFLPNIYHPLWGQFFLRLRSQVPEYPWYAPGFIYLGMLPLLLAIIALAPRLKGRDATLRPSPRLALFLSGLVSAILALGTTLHVAGQRVYLPVPPAVEEGFSRLMIILSSKLALHTAVYSSLRSSAAIPLPLPGFLAFLFLPLFSAMRHWYRFGIITTLAVAVLAGLGAAMVLRRWSNASRQAMAAAVLIGLVLLDFVAVPLPYGLSYTSIVQPVDRWLAQQPGEFAIMQFPLVRALNGPMLYRGIVHGKRMTYGHGTFYPPSYVEAEKTLGRFPEPACLDMLKAWGVRYIIVGSRSYAEGWGDLPGQTWESMRKTTEASGRLRLVQTFDEIPFWKDERVSAILRKELTPDPISVDHVYVYELTR